MLPSVSLDTIRTMVYGFTDSSGGTDSVSFTATVAAVPSPPPGPTGPPPADPPPTTGGGSIVKTGVNVSSSTTYRLRLSGSVEVSVELTGMTRDFDCRVNDSSCTNYGNTRDDSWSGTLGAGDHKIVVYPYGGGTGDYTLTISARTPSTGGGTGTRTEVTTLVDASETGVSASRTYGFTLARGARVDVALTGLTIDFDCRVGGSGCTNYGSIRSDSWSGDLGAGNHSVDVYPYDPGPGDYSLTVTATETLGFVSTPLAGGPPRLVVLLCEEEDGIVIEGSCIEVVIPLGDGGDGGDEDGGGGGGGGGNDDDDDDEETPEQKENTARDDATARAQRYNCRLFFRQNGELDIVGALGRVSFDRDDSRNQCTDPADAAYTLRDGNQTIYTCPLFYDGSDSLRADTVLHEMLHLAGEHHEPGDEGSYHQDLIDACP